MKLHLFQEVLALNEEFGHLLHGLERMDQEPTYKKEMIRWAKAHVQSAQVEANRQFFDEFDAIVENDAIGYTNFCATTGRGSPTPTMSIWRSNSARKHAKLRDFRHG